VNNSNRRGRHAVARSVAGFARHLAHHLRAHVLKGIRELDFLGYRDTVFGDVGRAPLLIQHHVAALRPQRCGYCFRQFTHAAQHRHACRFIKPQVALLP
jgi:hypothetical protein